MLALLPALLLWTASGSACLAMLAAASPAAAAEQPTDPHAAHGMHHHADHPAGPAQAPPAPAHDCPHCPPHAGTSAAHDSCAESGAAQAQRSGSDVGATLAPPHVVAATVVAREPPPSHFEPRGADPPPPHVPLNLRHCVLLI